MKKILPAALLVLTLAACGSTEPEPEPNDDLRAEALRVALEVSSAADRAAVCDFWVDLGPEQTAAVLNQEIETEMHLTADIVDEVFGEVC